MGVLVNPYWHLTGANTAIGAQLGDESAGLALDFMAILALVRGHTTNFLGDPNSLLTYSSPSTKWITNGLGVLSSGTTLRCDHDPATLDSSTTSLNSLGVGTGIPIQMSVVTTGAVTYSAGQVVRITDAADVTKWMVGTVVSWTAGTSTLVVNVYASTGYISGSSWKVIVALGLLIEEQRTNIWTDSGALGTGMSLSNVTNTDSGVAAPTGLNYRRLEVTASAAATCGRTFSTAGSTSGNTVSFYVKQGSGASDGNSFMIRNSTTATNLLRVTINFSTGAITYVTGSTGATASRQSDGGWRITLTVTSGVSNGDSLTCYCGFLGSAETAGEYLLATGAQMETGAFATSYIPAAGSTVARAADSISILTSAFPYSAAAGSWLAEFKPRSTGSTRVIGANNAEGPITVGADTTVASFNGVTLNRIGVPSMTTAAFTRAGLAYDSTGRSLTAAGLTVVSDANPMGTPTSIFLGSQAGSVNFNNGWLRRASNIRRRRSSSELQTITA